jgi:hypothetical protein
MKPVPYEGLREALRPLMRERTPSDAQLEELRRLGVVAQVRRQARGETPLYDPMRVVTALASVNLPLTRALTEESQTVLPGLSLTELAEVLSTRLGPGAPSLSTLRNWERSDRIAPVRISPSQRRFYDPEQVVAAIAATRPTARWFRSRARPNCCAPCSASRRLPTSHCAAGKRPGTSTLRASCPRADGSTAFPG